MLLASVGDMPDWIQALGVVVALGVSAYQLRQQAADAKDNARRHEQTERDAAARHRQEMADRRRERLLTYHAPPAQGIEQYLSNMAIAEQLSGDAEELARASADRRDPKLKESALTMQTGAMSHQSMARECTARASTVHVTARFDESPTGSRVVVLLLLHQVACGLPETPGITKTAGASCLASGLPLIVRRWLQALIPAGAGPD